MNFNRIILGVKYRLEILLRVIVSLFPRDKKLIVYGGSWDLFIDNAKHIFILNNEQMHDYAHIWLTNNVEVLNYMAEHNFNAFRSNSFRGIWTLLRAGFIIYDDGISYFSYHNLSMGATRINIWHGVPAKMIGSLKKDEDYVCYKQRYWWEEYSLAHVKGDYCICPSSWQKRFFSCSFDIPDNNVLIGGYPRNRFMFMDEVETIRYIYQYESEDFINLYERIKGSSEKKYIYMPTFRDNDITYLSKSIPDWEQLNDYCKKYDITFYLKVHRVTSLPDLTGFSHIKVLDNKMDVYPLLPLFDRLITDYSSVMFDFALKNKKVVLYTYDLEEYRNHSRPLYNHFLNLIMRVSVVSDFPSLLVSLSKTNNEIIDFPADMYFDNPSDWNIIPQLIRKYSC